MSCCSIDNKIDGCGGVPCFCEGFLAEKSPQMIFIGDSFVDNHMVILLILCKFIGCAISRELCNRMRFLPDYAKSHHRILSEVLNNENMFLR